MSESELLDDDFILHTNYTRDKFKLLTNTKNGSSKRIAVYEPNRQFVRVYEETSKEHHFRCIECHSKKQEIKATFSKDGQMFKVFEPFSHVCSPLRYSDIAVVGNTLEDVPMDEQPEDEPMPSTSELSSSEEEEVNVSVIRRKNKKKNNVKKKKNNVKKKTNNVKKKKYFDSNWKEMDASKFEFGHTSRNIPKTRLMVFESENPDEIRIYYNNAAKTHYKCLKCNEAKAFVESNTVKVLRNHSCPFDSYAEAKAVQEPITENRIRIVYPEEYEYGMNKKREEKKRLIIFEPNDRSHARYYGYEHHKRIFKCLKCRPKHVAAKVLKDENGNEYVEISKDHVCKPRPYKNAIATVAADEQPRDEPMSSSAEEENINVNIHGKKGKNTEVTEINEWKELDSSKFEFGHNSRKIPKSRLLVFESENPDEIRIYGINATKTHYKCLKCDKGKAFVKNDTVTVLPNHSCPFDSYAQVKAEQEIRIVHPEEYEYGINKKREEKKRLIIFEPNDRSLARNFGYDYQKRGYLCLKCRPKVVVAKVLKDENGNEYVKISRAHFCNPQPYTKIKAEQDAFNYASEKYKIFKSREFKFFPNASGVKKGRLFIFPEKDQGYQYFHDRKRNVYICLGCHHHHIVRKAHIIKDKNGKEIISADMSHICEMVNYQDVLNEQERFKEGRKPEVEQESLKDASKKYEIFKNREGFKLLTNSKNDSMQRIAVFERNDRRLVRVYEATSKEYHYQCIECHSKKQEIKATLSKNGQIFKVFEPFSHVCSPLKYLDIVTTIPLDEQPLDEQLANEQSGDEPMPSPSSSSSSEEKHVNVSLISNNIKKRKVTTKQIEIDNEWKELDSSKFEFGYSSRRNAKPLLMVFESEDPDEIQIYKYHWRKKSYKCLKCNEANAFVDGNTVKVLRDHTCPFQSYAEAKAKQERITQLRIVHPEEYEYGMNRHREAKKRLIIFEPNDRSLAREYSYDKEKHVFRCIKCCPKNIVAKVLKDENGNEYVEVLKAHHCKPQSYIKIKAEQDALKDASQKYEIFKDRKFKFLVNSRGVEKGRLIIFPTVDQCYVYFRFSTNTYICLGCNRDPHNVRKTAQIIKDNNGKECVNADMSHVCEMVNYQDVMDEDEKLEERKKFESNLKMLDSSKFEFGCTSKRVAKRRLLVFEFENPEKVQIYGISNHKKFYKCLKCNKARAFVDDDTVWIFQDHSCPGESYAKLKAEQEIRIVHPEEYEYGMNKKRGAKKQLIIFEPNDRSLARDYIYDYPKRAYLCLKCRPKVVVAKVLKDKNGIEYVKISRAHFCNPRPYKNAVATVAADEQPLDEPMSLSAEEENINVSIHGKKGKNKKVTETEALFCNPRPYKNAVATVAADEQPLDEPMSLSAEKENINVSIHGKKNKNKEVTEIKKWKELDSSKFEFCHNSRKIPKSRILVFESENPDEIRIYDIDLKKTHYKCLKCDKGKAFVKNDTVTVLQNHTCPFESYAKVNAEQEVRIVHPEQYEYGMNKKREEKKRLIIFEPNDRSHARDYGYDSQRRVYACLKCRPKYVAAKVLKDKRGHEHVEVLNAHRCKPRRYKRIKAEQNAFKDAPE